MNINAKFSPLFLFSPVSIAFKLHVYASYQRLNTGHRSMINKVYQQLPFCVSSCIIQFNICLLFKVYAMRKKLQLKMKTEREQLLIQRLFSLSLQ